MTSVSEELVRTKMSELFTTKFVGIVTVLFNSDDVLTAFIESLAHQVGIRYRLYVVDNSETDTGSQLCSELTKKYGIDCEIVFNNANVGVARGNNQGIERALRDGCTEVLLSNNDIEFTDPSLIIKMLAFADSHTADAVVPKIYYHDEPSRIWCAGGRFSLHAATTPHIGDGEIDRGQHDVACPIAYAPTCFMLLRANVFEHVGLMDARYFVYYDDTDFVWRMKTAGKRLYYWPGGEVWHKVSSSTGGSESLFSLYYGYRNRIYFVRKNYPYLLRAVAITYIFATLLIKFARFDAKRCKAVLRGLREGFAMTCN